MIIITGAKKNDGLPRPGTVAMWMFLLFLLGYFLKSPTLAAGSVSEALNVCAKGLIPSLFPFIVLVSIIGSSGLPVQLARLIGRPVGWLLGIDSRAVYALILGALGGFPIGAVCTRELYDEGVLDEKSAPRLCALTNNASPAFCIGGLGISLFGSYELGLHLYLCQLAAALIIGVVTRHGRTISAPEQTRPVEPLSDSFTRAVSQGGLTMLKICSFAVFFAVIGDAVCLVAERFFGSVPAAICAALCELTLAGRRAAGLSGQIGEVLCAFAVGWAGLSVHMQTASVLSGSGLHLRKYYVYKLCQGLLTALLAFVTG